VDTVTIVGTLVACEERPYGSFTDRQTGEVRPGGSTYWAHVVPEFDGAVIPVKVAQGDVAWPELQAMGFGSTVRIVAQLAARQNKIERRLISADLHGDA
jgi:hypothetical protein